MLGTILFVLILTTYSGMKNGETLIVGFKAAILPALIGGAVMTILYIPGIKLMTGYPKAVYKRLNKTIYKMSDEELRILENH
ncbi:MAG TPA: hypothetical protein GX707_09165 [Epulopiscium sp.]|nr:hypothetical protein [Candidatus Epulonipiscium sp.]